MMPAEAAKLLDLPVDATPEQLEARFLELRARLEDKIAKAPTPGLKAKYRESLEQITAAFETLTLAADGSALPVVQKQSAVSSQLSAGGPASLRADAPAPGTPRSAVRKPKSNKEFLLVAFIALAVLAGGGWFVMKTRAETAEKARLATEAAERKQAEEKAEAARLAALKTSLRTKLAEARLEWEAQESLLNDAERRATELKSELRGLRDSTPQAKAELSARTTAQDMFARWLKGHLLRHPAKLARVRTAELVEAGALDEALAASVEMADALAQLTEEVADRRKYFFETTTGLRIESQPAGVAWILTDAYGRVHEGKTPANLKGLPLTHLISDGIAVAPLAPTEKNGEFSTGTLSVRFIRPGWEDIVKETTAFWEDNDLINVMYPEGTLKITSVPDGVPFVARQAGNLGWSATGTTPATLTGVPIGRVIVTVQRPGFAQASQTLNVEDQKTAETSALDQRSQEVTIAVAEPGSLIFVDGKHTGAGPTAVLANLTPGEHALQLEQKGYPPYRTKFTVKQEATKVAHRFSFKELAVQNITCSACSGAGQINHQERCNQCNGTAWVDCPDCQNGIAGYVDGDYGGGVIGQKMVMCSYCSKKGRLPCQSCTNGIHSWQTTCSTCSGDGKVSKLQL